MQDPAQPTSPVDPQAVALTGQSMSPSQVVADSTKTVADPTQVGDPQIPDLQQGESPPEQNPLDVLETILAEAKQKAGQREPGTGTSEVGDSYVSRSKNNADSAIPPGPLPPTPEEIAAQEAARHAEIEQQKQQLMAQIIQTPEYQARIQQNAEKAEEESKSKAGGDGFQIRQLQHTKI